jgi:deazaflavin-dependent oxidoreductase (nitroreductase family)
MSDLNAWNKRVIEQFRANDGRVGGDFEGAPLLLLHTHGAKTNEERVNPVMYLEYEGRLFVFASKAGADTNPDWYYNLVANPEVTVELGGSAFAATATVIRGEERGRIYGVQAQRLSQFGDYQTRTTRVIPVVELRHSPSD